MVTSAGLGIEQERDFTLLGHDCPYGQYPAPVIPIGRLNGRLVAIYPGGSAGRTIEDLQPDSVYVDHDLGLQTALQGFNYLSHRLFAYSERDVSYYAIAEEKKFLDDFLATPRFRHCNRSIRSMLQKHAGTPACVSRP
jgi:hypothetical protein